MGKGDDGGWLGLARFGFWIWLVAVFLFFVHHPTGGCVFALWRQFWSERASGWLAVGFKPFCVRHTARLTRLIRRLFLLAFLVRCLPGMQCFLVEQKKKGVCGKLFVGCA